MGPQRAFAVELRAEDYRSYSWQPGVSFKPLEAFREIARASATPFHVRFSLIAGSHKLQAALTSGEPLVRSQRPTARRRPKGANTRAQSRNLSQNQCALGRRHLGGRPCHGPAPRNLSALINAKAARPATSEIAAPGAVAFSTRMRAFSSPNQPGRPPAADYLQTANLSRRLKLRKAIALSGPLCP
jgi:hypothetical protein